METEKLGEQRKGQGPGTTKLILPVTTMYLNRDPTTLCSHAADRRRNAVVVIQRTRCLTLIRQQPEFHKCHAFNRMQSARHSAATARTCTNLPIKQFRSTCSYCELATTVTECRVLVTLSTARKSSDRTYSQCTCSQWELINNIHLINI